MKKLLVIIVLLFAARIDAFGQWVQTNGPKGGQVTCLFSDNQNIIAGSTNGYVFVSTDSGNTWRDVGFADTAVYAVAGNGNVIFAATATGVFRSSNNGIEWVPSNSGLSDSTINSFGIMGSNLFIGSWNGIFLSTDSGSSWENATGNLAQLTTIDEPYIIGAIDTKLLAGTLYGIYLSTDSGKSWSDVGRDLSPRGFTQSHIIAMGNVLIAQDNGGIIYFSTDSGKSWQERNNTSSYPLSQPIAIGSTLYAGATDHYFYSSIDTGAQWSEDSYAASKLYLQLSLTSLVSCGTNLIAADAHNSGLFLSTDTGKTWSNNGPSNSDLRVMAVSGENLFAGDYKTADLGGSWIPDTNLVGVTAFSTNGSDLFAATGLMIHSTNSGANWIRGNVVGVGAPDYVTNLAAIGNNLFAGMDREGIFRSTDRGEDWIVVDDTQYDVLALGVIGTKLFASMELFSGISEVLESTDFGESWSSVNINLIDNHVNAFTVNSGNLFAGTVDGIFLSRDSGLTWFTTDSGLPPNSDVQAFVEAGSNLFASVRTVLDNVYVGYIYLSTNNGTSWVNVSNGLPLYLISALAVADSNLFASTAGSGVWRRPLSEMIPPQSAVEIPAMVQTTLTAYPNPLSQSTTIQFTSPESGVARVTVVNLLGEEVARVFDGTLSAGEHSFTWDTGTMPAGMYECIVDMNGSVQQTPMMISR